nr:hypothetical protein [Tanacetum cinerariifolium]
MKLSLSMTEFVDELAHIISPPEYDCFYFKDLPDPGELMSVLNSEIRENFSTTLVNLPIEDDYSPLLAYVVWIFVSYLKKFNLYSFFETPKVLLLAGDRVFEIKDAFGNKQYKPEDMQELFCKLFNDVQNIHEELAKYISTSGWNRPAFYNNGDDGDVDYTIAITPVLSTEEPDNSLMMTTLSIMITSSMLRHHLTILSSSVLKDVAEIVIPKDEEIEDDNLHEKLLNVNLLIAKIEALKDNPTLSSEFLTKSSSTSPKSFLDETNTFDNSLPEFENVYFDLEEISSGSTTTHSDISLPNYEAFYFHDDHIEEISSGSTTTHSDISLSEYGSFIFNLSND